MPVKKRPIKKPIKMRGTLKPAVLPTIGKIRTGKKEPTGAGCCKTGGDFTFVK